MNNNLSIDYTTVDYMKIDVMDIYELLKEENQQFWDFLELERINLTILMAEIDENYIVEEIEAI